MCTSLRPFFTYFGGKWRAAPKYPPPIYDTIIEPFAGSAGYSLRYPDRKVILVEKSEPIAAIWQYLIQVKPNEILGLPDLAVGQDVATVVACQEAKWLIGMWLSVGVSAPRNIMTAWSRDSGKLHMANQWSAAVRKRIARQLPTIRHWRVICGDYHEAPDVSATWFIDPPYEGMGKHYPCGADDLDFVEIARWSRERRGQVLVCEQSGAGWMPFGVFGGFKCNHANTGRTRSAEALWMNDWPGAALWLPARTP